NANVSNSASTGNLNILLAGNVNSQGTGIVANDSGTSNINITTLKGFDINTVTADGIDATATGGGSIHVNLLDWAINANNSHNTAVPGPAMNLSATSGGVITVNAKDTQKNFGGNGDQTVTVNGENEVGI